MSFITVPEATVHSAQGIDVSNHNNPEPTVAQWNNYQFGFAKATEGTTFKDGFLAENWGRMKRAGIHRGAYHFFHPAIDPIAQAKFFVDTMKVAGLGPGDMLVADVELVSGGAIRRMFKKTRNNLTQQPVSAGTVNVTAKAFLDEVVKLVGTKNPVIVYTDLSVGSQLTGCTSYPLWIASPGQSAPANVSPWRHWTFWQWGQTGTDRDAFNGTAADLDAFIKKYTADPPPPGMHRHVLTTDTSVKAIADHRQESVAGFFKRQTTMTDADAELTVYKAGSVYLTLNP